MAVSAAPRLGAALAMLLLLALSPLAEAARDLTAQHHADDAHHHQRAARVAARPLSSALDTFIDLVPKAELHVHVEGTLEPAMMLAIAERNGLPPPYPSVEAAEAAYQFEDLQVRDGQYNAVGHSGCCWACKSRGPGAPCMLC